LRPRRDHPKLPVRGGRVLIGGRLRTLREQRGLSQGDLEKASGLLRCYISRVEHGHTVPSLETLEKFATAFGVPLYQLFYEGELPPPTPHLTPSPTLSELAHRSREDKTEALLLEVGKLATRLRESDRSLLLDLAVMLAGRSKKKNKTPL
jgi:transcriptional regulator with XRE-family HTH domain